MDMDWLNYHHLRYFWAIAKEGSLRKAAEKLHVSQPSISAQVHQLEAALGESLFRRSGRTKVLTDAGQIVYHYAEEIFSLGSELVSVIRQRPTSKAIRLSVGVADSFPKLVIHRILKPVFSMPQTVRLVCREGKVEDLLTQLGAHRLDIVLADEAAAGSTGSRIHNHPLGETGTSFCAVPRVAVQLKRGFPRSLDGAPALLPAENTALRRALEHWFGEIGIRPQVVAEFDDLALMHVFAVEGRGFIAVPSVVVADAVERYHFQPFGVAKQCTVQFYAITAERRITHPAVATITQHAKSMFQG